MMYGYDGTMGGGTMVFAWLVWLLVVVNLTLLAVFLWQKVNRRK